MRAIQQQIMREEYAGMQSRTAYINRRRQQLAEGQPRAWESFPETD